MMPRNQELRPPSVAPPESLRGVPGHRQVGIHGSRHLCQFHHDLTKTEVGLKACQRV